MTADQSQGVDLSLDSEEWLNLQPGMSEPSSAAASLHEQLTRWTADYSERVCEQRIDGRHAHLPRYLARLWACWKHHWQQAWNSLKVPVDGCVIAEQLRAGRGVGGGQLGGDPLRDVVLAVAMTENDQQAPRQFHSDYYELSRRIAVAKVGPRLGASAEEWWTDFLDHLGGYTGKAAKLDRFEGRSALAPWLRTVLWCFLHSWLRRQNLPDGGGDEQLAQLAAPQDEELMTAETRDCRVLVLGLLSSAVAELSGEERLVLSLLLVDGRPNGEAAKILGIHPGNVTRKRDKAIERLQQALHEQARAKQCEQALAECMECLLGARDFAVAVASALATAQTSDAT